MHYADLQDSHDMPWKDSAPDGLKPNDDAKVFYFKTGPVRKVRLYLLFRKYECVALDVLSVTSRTSQPFFRTAIPRSTAPMLLWIKLLRQAACVSFMLHNAFMMMFYRGVITWCQITSSLHVWSCMGSFAVLEMDTAVPS
jgi:hypothetical protein